MLDPKSVPPVDHKEVLARFVTQRSQFRPSDGTVKQNLFIPPPNLKLSVTRHRDATEAEIWQVGREVAREMSRERVRTLYGRCDIRCGDCESEKLRVEPEPLDNNPNHADILGWPEQKQDQKAIAIKLAAKAGKLIALPTAT